MKILVLGGTQFIGRNLVEALIKTDHAITLFNRGKTGADLYPNLPRITGDRQTSDIEKIRGDWDVVIDLSCYFPYELESTLAQLDPARTKYIFVSSCSAYEPNFGSTMHDENATLCSCTEEEAKLAQPETYGARKAECERILGSSGFSHSILRPALVYGKYDHTDRLYYWLHQVKLKDQLILPEGGAPRFSITYVKDLVAAIIKLAESDVTGTFNAISESETSIGQIVKIASENLNRSPNRLTAEASFLKQQGISQWQDMPLWINGDHFTYSNEKWKAELGLEPTSMEDGIRETISFISDWPEPTYGMPEERRRELIKLLNSSS